MVLNNICIYLYFGHIIIIIHVSIVKIKIYSIHKIYHKASLNIYKANVKI